MTAKYSAAGTQVILASLLSFAGPAPALLMSAPDASAPPAQEDNTSGEFLNFVQRQARLLRADDHPPASLEEWKRRKTLLRSQLLQSWGGFPAEPCPLEPRKFGELRRDGYRVEKIAFQTLSGVWMTSDAYVPDRPGRVPAVLCVHGHWPGAKQDPVVQSRCLGLVRQGYFVLAVDAMGAGERGVGKALGEYHGDMTAATLLPVGLTLCGLQVYENGRAVDYLLTRPEVDRSRVGITGASGGGNQTIYAGGWDERLSAVVPVCSVSNYQAYIPGGCCLCEVVPGALRYTEEWSVLGLSAPRALLAINATKDSFQFSVASSEKSLSVTRRVFELYGVPERIEHAVFESGHAYSRPMRETMYGWMAQYLKKEGDGSLILEPDLTLEDAEALRCYPGNSRPDDYVTIPRLAAEQGRRLLQRLAEGGRRPPGGGWRNLAVCLDAGDGAGPHAGTLISKAGEGENRTLVFEPEPDIRLAAHRDGSGAAKLAILLSLDGEGRVRGGDLAGQFRQAGWSVVTLDLRATGQLAWPHDRLRRAPDFYTAEWSLWIGRPLLGQWVVDIQGLLDALSTADGGLPRDIAVAGIGPAGLVAICAGALDHRITSAAAIGTLASYLSDVPYENQRLGVIAPNIVRDVGDVPQLAALLAPRRLVVAGGVSGAGPSLSESDLNRNYDFTRHAYEQANAADSFRLLAAVDPAEIVRQLQ